MFHFHRLVHHLGARLLSIVKYVCIVHFIITLVASQYKPILSDPMYRQSNYIVLLDEL
jgi:hypothetical protein